MNRRSSLRRAMLPAAAFVLSSIGALLVLPRDHTAANSSDLLPTVVVTARLERGTSTEVLLENVEVRQLPRDARADGAYSSAAEIPNGVLTGTHVPGQQVVPESVAKSRVASLGRGYAAVSVRLDTQRWTGPVIATGEIVDVYAVTNGQSELISARAVILDSPTPADMKPRDDAIITLGVADTTLARVIAAATEDRLWLAGG